MKEISKIIKKTLKALEKISPRRLIYIDRYTEIFNRKNQSFLLQKERPAIILAKKYSNFVHRLKPESGIGSENNFYFSHLLNCPYDCEYCFLKGIFRSSFFVFFINYEDFFSEIEKTAALYENSCFFSGFDADSLALDHLTDFSSEFISFFSSIKGILELRTKSTNISQLLGQKATENTVISFSMNPDNVIEKIERKTPLVSERLKAIALLQKKGMENWA